MFFNNEANLRSPELEVVASFSPNEPGLLHVSLHYDHPVQVEVGDRQPSVGQPRHTPRRVKVPPAVH